MGEKSLSQLSSRCKKNSIVNKPGIVGLGKLSLLYSCSLLLSLSSGLHSPASPETIIIWFAIKDARE